MNIILILLSLATLLAGLSFLYQAVATVRELWRMYRNERKTAALFTRDREFTDRSSHETLNSPDLRTKTVCAWCGTFLSGHPDAHIASHGICLPCKTVEVQKMLQYLRPHGFWEIKDTEQTHRTSLL